MLGTMGLVALFSQVLPMDDSVPAIILLIGLAVGVDYTMFYLKREREERAAGRSEEAALEAAAATSGRSVLISGSTVLVAMAGMFLTGDAGFASFGVATMTVVAVAMLGSLTVLPALLSKLGDSVDRVRVPFVHRLRRNDGEGRIWGAIIDRVLRRPVLSVALAGGLLIALAVPALQLHTAEASIDSYPQKFLTSYNRVKAAFPGTEIAANVVIKAPNVEAPQVRGRDRPAQAARVGHRRHERADRRGRQPRENRREHLDPGRGQRNGLHLECGARGAARRDRPDHARHPRRRRGRRYRRYRPVEGLQRPDEDRRSARVRVRAAVRVRADARLLPIAGDRGEGDRPQPPLDRGSLRRARPRLPARLGEGLLGFEYTGGIDPFLPILLFVILFGLSMDYHVFIISRVRESYDKGMSTDDAIAHGIKTTAGVVTSAAIVMVGVFAIFATLSMMILKQFGVGLAAAILIDATIVRAILLPASMKLLGEWNWYLPTWLEWLPHLEHGDTIEEAPEAPPHPRRSNPPRSSQIIQRRPSLNPAGGAGAHKVIVAMLAAASTSCGLVAQRPCNSRSTPLPWRVPETSPPDTSLIFGRRSHHLSSLCAWRGPPSGSGGRLCHAGMERQPGGVRRGLLASSRRLAHDPLVRRDLPSGTVTFLFTHVRA